jgi:hypothetical protein
MHVILRFFDQYLLVLIMDLNFVNSIMVSSSLSKASQAYNIASLSANNYAT